MINILGTVVDFEEERNYGHILDNCGPYENYLHRFKLTEGYKLTEVESMLISSDDFAAAPTKSLMICVKKD